MIYLLTEIG